MVLGEVHVRVEVVHDGERRDLREPHHRVDRARVTPEGLGDDDGVLRHGQDAGGLLNGVGGRDDVARARRARGVGVLEALVALGQHLARQGQVDGALRLGLGDREGAVDDGLELDEVPELVVPLDELADHRALVEGLLGPVDLALPASREPRLGDRVAPRGEEHRYPAAGRVDDAAEGVRGADDHVDHDRLWTSRDHGVAVGHPHGRRLMGHRDGAREELAVSAASRVRLDDRREVGTGVAEEVLDAPGRQQL